MSSLSLRLASILAGVLSGILLTGAGVFLWPFPFEARTAAALEALAAGGGREEFFYLDITGDTVLVTHGGAFPFKPIPEGIGHTGDGQTPGTLALVSKFRTRAGGEVVAFGTELEIAHEDSSLLTGRLMTHTLWSIVVPDRGVLHLYQLEINWRLAKEVILPMLLSGEPYEGRHSSINTFGPLDGYQGLIVGGTGEFAGARGRFLELGTLTHAAPDGRIRGQMELRIRLDPQ